MSEELSDKQQKLITIMETSPDKIFSGYEIAKLIDISYWSTSVFMSKLKDKGLVETFRYGNTGGYRIKNKE
jgi:DNA-binding IscR family transcriptional regulator